MLGYIILAAIIVFSSVIIIKALRFKPFKSEDVQYDEIEVDEDKIISDMVSMIRCRTVSNRDESLVDRGEFKRFQELLKKCYPLVHEKCTLKKIGKTGLLYYLKGKSNKKPSVCMAHYDVVPADEKEWEKPPFEGIVEDGVIWGRGTLDTKGTVLGIFEAAEMLLFKDFVPQNDLYFSFSGEEEIDGKSCYDIVTYLKDNGIKPSIVLDEGGAVVDNVFPGVKEDCALVGVGEKGSVNMNFVLEGKGGHASTPPPHSILGQLSKAVVKIEKHPFKRQMAEPVLKMFDILGRYSSFTYRMIFANLWCFAPLLDLVCKKSGGEMNALFRTTVAITRMKGSKAYNVFPAKASFGINMRLLGTDTIESATKYLQGVIKNKSIKPELVNGMNPSIYSDTSCDEWNKLTKAIRQTWIGAIISPYLMMACSDSRHYLRITDRVYRFCAMKLSKEERAMIHGKNERVPVDTLVKTVQFYVRFIRML